MKRLVRSRSGTLIYGPKWQNNFEGTSNEIDTDDGSLPSAALQFRTEVAQVSVTQPGNTISIAISEVPAAAPTVSTETNAVLDQLPITGQDNESQTSRVTSLSTGSRRDGQSMYRAALGGDWLAAEVLVARHPNLVREEVTERGDRALHVAAAMKRKVFVQKLVQLMSPADLELLDGHGYTACCYAAIAGKVEIAEVMMQQNPNLGTARDRNNITPLNKAAMHGRKKMVSYFLQHTAVESLPRAEWFDLLLVTIRRKMYDVALEILEKDGSLATMRNDEGTALHLLARLDISLDFINSKLEGRWALEIFFGKTHALIYVRGWRIKYDGEMQSDLRLLAEKLWAEIQRLEEAGVLELMKDPPILHDAAKVGNVELITMITRTYPDLIWDADKDGHTIFHIAVIHRHENVFNLIHQIGALKDLIAASQDKNGNNILHLAAELAPPDIRKVVPLLALQMKREITWFKQVQAIAPPSCLEMRNNDGLKPRELFSKQHKSLLEKSETWMRNTADSCMLVATIMLTVVFAAAFTPPGGFDGKTGMPLLLKRNWFTCFVIFEALALLGSTWSIMYFWSIMTSSFEEEKFQFVLPRKLRRGLAGLLGSLIGAITAFTSAYFLVFVEEKAALVKPVILVVYVILVYAIYALCNQLSFDVGLPVRLSRRMMSRPGSHTLFKRHDTD